MGELMMNNEAVNENIDEVVEETATEPTNEVTEPTDVEETTAPPAEPVFGIVTGCKKLNIRNKPAVNPNNIVTIVDAGTELLIDPDEETGEWYKVVAPNAVEGFCMKKFVTID